MLSLAIPDKYKFNFDTFEGTTTIFDKLRRKYVRLTPEEWVRQNFVQLLIHEYGFPQGLTAIEKPLTYEGMHYRADVVIYNRQLKPILIAECKAPELKITQQALDQIGRYNRAIKARYLAITNGIVYYCCSFDSQDNSYRFLDNLPYYERV